MPWLNTGVLKSRSTNCNVSPWALLIVKPKHGRRGKYCRWKVNTGKVIMLLYHICDMCLISPWCLHIHIYAWPVCVINQWLVIVFPWWPWLNFHGNYTRYRPYLYTVGSGRVVISAVANKDWCPPVPLFMVQHYFTLSCRNCRRAGRRGERSAGRRRHRDCDTQGEELHGHVGVQEGGWGSARQKPHSR